MPPQPAAPFQRLNNYVQKNKATCTTEVKAIDAPTDADKWIATVELNGVSYTAKGPSKMDAKNAAAQLALNDL
ncbi:hypothetical protein BJ165DRAFT_1510534 [Panaeolus papilionaceus]|nr:hypothetical protein BJ165DRAFT_1510534 [Panaeolus papilionaceus]